MAQEGTRVYHIKSCKKQNAALGDRQFKYEQDRG